MSERATSSHEASPTGSQSFRPRLPVAAAGWTGLLALVWVLLALWRPETTWHLAPALLAAAWPWIIGQGQRAGERAGITRAAAGGAAGFTVSAAVALALSTGDLLRGPTLGGWFPNATVEALAAAAAGAFLVVLVGVLRALRTPAARSAWMGEEQVASSEDVVMVEGNAYFPMSAVRAGALTESPTRSVCPWKGVARYYTLEVDGVQVPDAAWVYPRPLPFAARIKGRVAFGGVVEVRSD